MYRSRCLYRDQSPVLAEDGVVTKDELDLSDLQSLHLFVYTIPIPTFPICLLFLLQHLLLLFPSLKFLPLSSFRISDLLLFQSHLISFRRGARARLDRFITGGEEDRYWALAFSSILARERRLTSLVSETCIMAPN